MQKMVLSECMWVLLGPQGAAHWNPSPGSHLLCIPFIILYLSRNHPWVYMLRYSFHFPLWSFLSLWHFFIPAFGFSFLLGKSSLSWTFSRPVSSCVPLSSLLSQPCFLLGSWAEDATGFLEATWKPGAQGKQEGSEGMGVWTCKALGSKGRGRPPYFHRALLCFAFLVSLVPVGC